MTLIGINLLILSLQKLFSAHVMLRRGERREVQELSRGPKTYLLNFISLSLSLSLSLCTMSCAQGAHDTFSTI